MHRDARQTRLNISRQITDGRTSATRCLIANAAFEADGETGLILRSLLAPFALKDGPSTEDIIAMQDLAAPSWAEAEAPEPEALTEGTAADAGVARTGHPRRGRDRARRVREPWRAGFRLTICLASKNHAGRRHHVRRSHRALVAVDVKHRAATPRLAAGAKGEPCGCPCGLPGCAASPRAWRGRRVDSRPCPRRTQTGRTIPGGAAFRADAVETSFGRRWAPQWVLFELQRKRERLPWKGLPA